jgi:hypothetical protein
MRYKLKCETCGWLPEIYEALFRATQGKNEHITAHVDAYKVGSGKGEFTQVVVEEISVKQ